MEFYKGNEFVLANFGSPVLLVDPIVPAGITLLHGAPGVGKSTLAWQLAQAIQTGSPFLGLPTRQANVLLYNIDMPKIVLHNRWKMGRLVNQFDLLIDDPFDVTDGTFHGSEREEFVGQLLAKGRYGLVIVDALGHVHFQKDSNELPSLVYGIFRRWFGDCSVLFIHHDRKRIRLESGGRSRPDKEDFLGSQLWAAFATSCLHMYSISDSVSRLSHTKCQATFLLPEPLDVMVDDSGTAVTLWTEDNATKIVEEVKRVTGLQTKATKGERVKEVAGRLGVSERTVWRWAKTIPGLL